jgi:hypothetical protein
MTIWPTGREENIELSAPGPDRYTMHQPDQRWTGAFDVEGRANRMSQMVGNSLLPPAPHGGGLPMWPGENRSRNRATWINGENYQQEAAQGWDGSFDVEKRASWISRNSERWSDDFQIDKEKVTWKEPLTAEQIAKADSALVSLDVLNHNFGGFGTPEDPYLVKWMDNDPANPLLFSKATKWTNATVLALAVFMVSIASSGFSQGKKIW